MRSCLAPAILLANRLSYAHTSLKETFLSDCELNRTGFTGVADQARAKLRANDIRLAFALPSADLRLIS